MTNCRCQRGDRKKTDKLFGRLLCKLVGLARMRTKLYPAEWTLVV